MTRIRDSRPSPALIVAVLALIAAVGGTALAGQEDAAKTEISKKKVKKIANKQINKRLPLGTKDIADNAINAAKVLDGSLGTAEFSSLIPAVRATRTADQSIPFQSNDATTLSFDSERYDTAALHDDAINNSRLTAPITGIYAVSVEITLSHTAPGGFRVLTVQKNGAGALARATETPPTSGTQSIEASTEVRLQAGDYIEASVFHDASGLTVKKLNDSSPEFSMTWLAPGP